MRGRPISELVEETQVVFKKQTDVGDAVLSHSEAFHAETEGPAGVFFAVNSDGIKNIGVNHAAATHLYPIFFAGAVGPEQIDLGTGLGEGKKARAKSPLRIGTEEGVNELVDGGLHIHHRDIFIDDERFELVKHIHMRCVNGVGAVDAAGGDDTNGGLFAFHNANLNCGGLTSQKSTIVDVEIVERVSCGMLLRDIQGGEIVPLVFDFWAISDIKAHSAKDFQQLVYGFGDDVRFADSDGYARQSDVDKLLLIFAMRFGEVIFELLECGGDIIFYFVCDLSCLGSLLRREEAYLSEHL